MTTTKEKAVSINAHAAVVALKVIGRSVKAKTIAEMLGTDSRAVATAMRGPVRDGRVTITYRKGFGWYRFQRLVAKAK